MRIEICKSEAQLQELSALAHTIWNEYFLGIITQEQIDYMVAKFQSYDAMKHAIEHEGYTYYLLYEEDLIGYLGVKLDGERVFLSKLYLRKDARGKGYASVLLNQAKAYAKQHQKQAIYLTCNKYNKHSLDVYAAKGFETIDAVVSDIGHGFVMDDYILELKL